MPTAEKNGGPAEGQGPPCCIGGVTARPVGMRFSMILPDRSTSSGAIVANADESLPSRAA